jgi:hypothetical protein
MAANPFVAQWLHNRSLIPRIPQSHPDWIVTVTFYTALHAINSLLSGSGADVRSHDERNEILMTTHTYAPIWIKYSPLYDMSRKVRYLANPEAWLPFSKLLDRVIKPYLYPIEKLVQQHLKIQLDLPPVEFSGDAPQSG